ncbi:MAG: hypothetical protein WAV08_08445 [Desulfobacterales bacterium]
MTIAPVPFKDFPTLDLWAAACAITLPGMLALFVKRDGAPFFAGFFHTPLPLFRIAARNPWQKAGREKGRKRKMGLKPVISIRSPKNRFF